MKNLLLLISLCVFSGLGAQTSSGEQGRSFSFFAGVESHLLGAGAGIWKEGDPYIDFQHDAIGFTLGFAARFPLLPQLFVQPELAFSYNRHQAVLWADNRPTGALRYNFADIELPVHLVLSNPVGRLPLRSSILFGGRMGLNVASPHPDGGIALLRERFGVDLGLGAEFRWGKWRLAPEVIYSHGMNDLHSDTGSPYDRAANRIVRDKISLRIGFGKMGKSGVR
ncbi:MAG: hypothetical protein JNL02_07245 [Saprospiraceae bacterium]|nr:hypothetical protein [Saprospiraceae bacterium]